jgi:ribosomal peptide maturation radical SAM protein 1
VRGKDVGLVSMPFGPLFAPSIGLSLLKSALTREGLASHIHYFTVRFAELTGSRFYLGVANGFRPALRNLAGEWIFSAALFGPGDEEEYVESILKLRSRNARRGNSPALINAVLRARRLAADFVDSCAREVLATEPAIVGLTSVFQQQTASLALAKRIKALRPETFVLMGGANCEGVMGAELVRQFEFIDAALSGEGDLIIAELVRRILGGRSIEGMPGVRTRAGVAAELAADKFSNAPTVLEMDDLPLPDYADYFEQFGRTRFAKNWIPRVFFETSRGCWWGEKMHCTFCGLNGATMQFRSKSANRALSELIELTARHPRCDVEMTDNILDLAYFKDLIPALARRNSDLGIFYETKANLRKEQIRMMRDAGIRSIQPGIESLADPVLKLMRKGVSALQNIQLLKWCKELGVEPLWNILWGFPGEPPEAYERMTKITPLLTHLRPPDFFSAIRLDRFSPNFFESDKLGFADVQPLDGYRFAFPGVSRAALHNLAYHFRFAYQQPQDVDSYTHPLLLALRDWQAAFGSSDLFSIDTGDHLIIWDLRPVARRTLTVLSGADRLLYLACDGVTDMRRISAALASSGAARDDDEITAMLAPLLADGLALQDGARYLALAVPLGDYTPARPVVEQFYGVVRTIGTPTDDGIAVSWNGGARHDTQRRFPRLNSRSLSAPQFRVDGPWVVIR